MLQDEKYSVPSDKLKEFKEAIKKLPKEFQDYFGSVFAFRIVVDTNIVLSDLRWLILKRKSKSARTALIEVIQAGSLEVYAPSSLLEEIEEHIPRICQEEGIDEKALKIEWLSYQRNIKFLDPKDDFIRPYKSGTDPDDAPFLALADMILASGVLSNDSHIKTMGGRKISVDFVMSLRDYSRETAIELNIKVHGLVLGLTTIAALNALFQAIKAIGNSIARAPDWVKLFLMLGIAFCVINPNMREKLSTIFKKISAEAQKISQHVLRQIYEASLLSQSNGNAARMHLSKALLELEKSKPNKKKVVRRRVIRKPAVVRRRRISRNLVNS
jgi:predicted nucleic acid-binding protein